MSKQPYHLGTYPLGYTNVEIYVHPAESFGGRFDMQPTTSSMPRMDITLDFKNWWEVVELLLHEAYEASFCLHHSRYCVSPTVCSDLSAFQFMFSHATFAEITAGVAKFVAEAYPALAAAYAKAKPYRTL